MTILPEKAIIFPVGLCIGKIIRSLNLSIYPRFVSTNKPLFNNASELSDIIDVDGFLIGGASLDVNKFHSIYNQL